MEAVAASAQAAGTFGVIQYGFCGAQDGREYIFYDDLARRHILSFAAQDTPPNYDEGHMRAMAPYEWNYFQAPGTALRNLAEVICKSLVGLPPSYGGPPTSQASKRVFGLIGYSTNFDGSPPLDTSPLENGTKACGVSWVKAQAMAGDPQTTDQAVLSMHTAGVTTIVPLINVNFLSNYAMPAATAQGYYPEWLITDYIANDIDTAANGMPKDQAAHLFGLMSWDKVLPESQMPYYWAGKEEDPNYVHSGSGSVTGQGAFSHPYWNLLTLASGIQMAGPNLTPQTFQQGLDRTVFPNPRCGGPPYYQACVGFYPDQHSMIRDFAAVWWDNAQFSYQGSAQSQRAGAYCYVDQGKRFSLGTWPSGPLPWFQPPCR